jgi:hypothetical protein
MVSLPTQHQSDAVTPVQPSLQRLLEKSEVGRRLIFPRGHQQSVPAQEIVLVADHDFCAVLRAVILMPIRAGIGVAHLPFVHCPRLGQGVIDRSDFIMKDVRICLVEARSAGSYDLAGDNASGRRYHPCQLFRSNQAETVMRESFLGSMVSVAIAATASVVIVAPTISASAQQPTASSATPATSTALKTRWGEPDLQGIWTDETDTPLQRLPKYAIRNFLPTLSGPNWIKHEPTCSPGTSDRSAEPKRM